MHPIKIVNFERAHPVGTFPCFRTLEVGECEQILQRLGDQLFGSSHNTGLEVVTEFRNRGVLVPEANALSDTFSLRGTMTSLGIEPRDKVFINWYQFDQIDEMRFSNLAAFFDDIWYPAADHIDLFDESLRWTVSIGYSGEVLAVQSV